MTVLEAAVGILPQQDEASSRMALPKWNPTYCSAGAYELRERARHLMKHEGLAVCCGVLLLFVVPANARTEASRGLVGGAAETSEAVTRDLFAIESSYVFESNLNHGGSFGKQSEIQNAIEYGHRIQVQGNYYLHLGLSYDRYDFGSTSAPPRASCALPGSLNERAPRFLISISLTDKILLLSKSLPRSSKASPSFLAASITRS
jgi:hypothetical protein